ncbi:hypothetical protein [Pseudonocardia endophytica]|uniref:hypothetical protein n=1 Tax=Pseudonocardia endophytica TaxID=401976 RepID=UPI001042D6B1|nr:hypothetical protein [Pseudonocardia endophytica]
MSIKGLREAARAVCQAAADQNCQVVVAASGNASPLVGATLIMADGDLQSIEEAEAADCGILVVETVAVTHANVDTCVNELTAAGFRTVKRFVYRDFAVTLSEDVLHLEEQTTMAVQ